MNSNRTSTSFAEIAGILAPAVERFLPMSLPPFQAMQELLRLGLRQAIRPPTSRVWTSPAASHKSCRSLLQVGSTTSVLKSKMS